MILGPKTLFGIYEYLNFGKLEYCGVGSLDCRQVGIPKCLNSRRSKFRKVQESYSFRLPELLLPVISNSYFVLDTVVSFRRLPTVLRYQEDEVTCFLCEYKRINVNHIHMQNRKTNTNYKFTTC